MPTGGGASRILHDFRRTVVRNLERAGVLRSLAMKLTGHKTEGVYRRDATVCEADLSEGLKKLAKLEETPREKMQPCGTMTDFSHSLATIHDENVQNTLGKLWRRGRDLNSRIGCPISSFQDWHVRPLRHPSEP